MELHPAPFHFRLAGSSSVGHGQRTDRFAGNNSHGHWQTRPWRRHVNMCESSGNGGLESVWLALITRGCCLFPSCALGPKGNCRIGTGRGPTPRNGSRLLLPRGVDAAAFEHHHRSPGAPLDPSTGVAQSVLNPVRARVVGPCPCRHATPPKALTGSFRRHQPAACSR